VAKRAGTGRLQQRGRGAASSRFIEALQTPVSIPHLAVFRGIKNEAYLTGGGKRCPRAYNRPTVSSWKPTAQDRDSLSAAYRW
jgi:hypothetical protein